MTACTDCARLQAEVEHWRGLYRAELRYGTLGGTPLAVNENEWANRLAETPEPGAEI